MWAVFSPHTLFNGICCPAVVCVSWHQQQRKSTLGLRGLVLLVCLCRSGFFSLFFFFSRANHHQSSSHTVISRPKLMDTSVGLWWEKVVPPCFSISVCNFNFRSFTEAPLLSLLISSQRISGGQVIYIFCFHFPPDTSTRGREQSDALSHWAHPAHLPTHQLGCERGPKEEGKWQGRLFH